MLLFSRINYIKKFFDLKLMAENKNIFDNNDLFFKIFLPSLKVNFSRGLLNAMKFTFDSCPKTLEQYLELWHPQDISKIVDFQNFIKDNRSFLELKRNLYCGDGIYRTFLLNAIKNSSEIICQENNELQIWLKNASEGEKFNSSGKILEASSVNGVMIIKDLSELLDLQQENLRLRREIQRRIFNTSNLPALFGNKQQEITIGIVGLKSSGKSSFVNAILGEKIIPEHNIASTRAEIICKKGDIREANIFHQDGRLEKITGSKLTADYMKKISSAFFAPGNMAGIFRIELVIPGSLIPEGVSIIDTPPFNPLEKYEKHRSKTKNQTNKLLKNLLPEFDLIIYVLPIRYGLKNYDYEFLDLLSSLDKKIIFVLTFSDFENDDFEAGQMVLTSHEKINSSVEKIKFQLKNYYKNSEFDIFPVSSKFALERFYDRQSKEWQFSNFNSILSLLENNSNVQVTKINFPKKAYQNESKDLLSSLIVSMREQELRTEFFRLKSMKNNQKIVMLSSDRDESLKLFSKLAHKTLLSKLPEGQVSSSEWLYSGYSMPFPCVKLPLTGMNDDILIAPSDKLIKENLYWENLFRLRVPVINIDLWRYELGFYELENAPYFYALKNFKWVIAFGNGIFLNNENQNFKQEIIKKIELFSRRNSLRKPDIFIFEDYNVILCQNV